MQVNRTTYGVTFNTGISTAEYNEAPAGQTKGQTQGSILPGSTTVTEAMDALFPKEPTVSAQILSQLAAAGSSLSLRTAHGFQAAARKAIGSLRASGGKAAGRAVVELETLLADTDLLDQYKASLLET
ncbi:MAG: hypothetical protein MJ249_03305 [Kiritimatiellae bacterium]|nr:hypothetical protein [Kiritimatiellia bacterium]